jgi:hypothetical protein
MEIVVTIVTKETIIKILYRHEMYVYSNENCATYVGILCGLVQTAFYNLISIELLNLVKRLVKQ